MAISTSTIVSYNTALETIMGRHIVLIAGDLHMMKAPQWHGDTNLYGRFMHLPELIADYMVNMGTNYFDAIEVIDLGVYQDSKGWSAQYLSTSDF